VLGSEDRRVEPQTIRLDWASIRLQVIRMMRNVLVGRIGKRGRSDKCNVYCCDEGGKGAVYFLLTGFRIDVGIIRLPCSIPSTSLDMKSSQTWLWKLIFPGGASECHRSPADAGGVNVQDLLLAQVARKMWPRLRGVQIISAYCIMYYVLTTLYCFYRHDCLAICGRHYKIRRFLFSFSRGGKRQIGDTVRSTRQSCS
jgi:hypothetical protein